MHDISRAPPPTPTNQRAMRSKRGHQSAMHLGKIVVAREFLAADRDQPLDRARVERPGRPLANEVLEDVVDQACRALRRPAASRSARTAAASAPRAHRWRRGRGSASRCASRRASSGAARPAAKAADASAYRAAPACRACARAAGCFRRAPPSPSQGPRRHARGAAAASARRPSARRPAARRASATLARGRAPARNRARRGRCAAPAAPAKAPPASAATAAGRCASGWARFPRSVRRARSCRRSAGGLRARPRYGRADRSRRGGAPRRDSISAANRPG